jgi:hypothetical protein
MDSRELTSEQCQTMQAALRPYVLWLHRVLRRMDARGFPLTDELYTSTSEAYGAMRDLTMALHYAGCQSGVGRSPKHD